MKQQQQQQEQQQQKRLRIVFSKQCGDKATHRKIVRGPRQKFEKPSLKLVKLQQCDGSVKTANSCAGNDRFNPLFFPLKDSGSLRNCVAKGHQIA